MRICSIKHCNRKHEAKGLCGLHYRRLKDHGSTDKPKRIRKNRVCDIEGCDRKHYAKGLCQNHYNLLPRIKEYQNRYNSLPRVKECQKQYRENPERKKHKKEYDKKYRYDNPDVLLRAVRGHFKKMGNKLNITSMEYAYAIKSWSATIKKLDNKMCKNCDSVKNLHAHHIQPKSLFPELALDLDNGITLCKKCHELIHGYKTY